jgi:hypothetical protein
MVVFPECPFSALDHSTTYGEAGSLVNPAVSPMALVAENFFQFGLSAGCEESSENAYGGHEDSQRNPTSFLASPVYA